ncbi:MAG: DUF559 domain-containing protein [Betaproteobacteria bacterium]|nr:DUF559 domain-containing protein [Betaproteobacteria bacterium]
MRQPLNNRFALKARRRELRRSLTVAEARLWSCLQRDRLGWKFRRQHSIGPFIVDFYCPSGRLAIELDGTAHDSESASYYDHKRSEYLREKGVRVIRFVNDDAIRNLEGVLHMIRAELSAVERDRASNGDENHTTPPANEAAAPKAHNHTTPPACAGTPPHERRGSLGASPPVKEHSRADNRTSRKGSAQR